MLLFYQKDTAKINFTEVYSGNLYFLFWKQQHLKNKFTQKKFFFIHTKDDT